MGSTERENFLDVCHLVCKVTQRSHEPYSFVPKGTSGTGRSDVTYACVHARVLGLCKLRAVRATLLLSHGSHTKTFEPCIRQMPALQHSTVYCSRRARAVENKRLRGGLHGRLSANVPKMHFLAVSNVSIHKVNDTSTRKDPAAV